MAEFRHTRELEGARFEMVSLRGACIREADLREVSMRGVAAAGLEIDTPDLLDGPILVDGVDVTAYVDAELDRRFPGRSLRRAVSPAGLRAAWAAVEAAWEQAQARVDAMPAGSVDIGTGGEWSFAQTQRHLVLATDTWLRRAILGIEQPFHEIGLPYAGYAEDGFDTSIFATTAPAYSEVVRVRAERATMVRDFLAAVTTELLDEPRADPWDPAHRQSVRACLHVILNEEWEHLRYATRDLDALTATSAETISD